MHADRRRWNRRTSAFIGVDRRFETLHCPSHNHGCGTKLDQFVNLAPASGSSWSATAAGVAPNPKTATVPNSIGDALPGAVSQPRPRYGLSPARRFWTTYAPA